LLASQSKRHVVQTPDFEGPLDLLLYLIRRDGIELRNLPVAHITREYLAFLDLMESMDLGVAGDFLVMAATLCQLKSRELLPRDPDLLDDEEEDPRERLVRRLIEYQRFKEASEDLYERPWLGREVYTRPEADLDPSDRPLARDLDSFALLESFYEILQRQAEEPPVLEVTLEEYSFTERVAWILERLEGGEPFPLERLFSGIQSRSQKVLTFLALLETTRLGMTVLEQDGHLAPVAVASLVRAEDADLSTLPQEGLG
jgi:segregation and condensation protein A